VSSTHICGCGHVHGENKVSVFPVPNLFSSNQSLCIKNSDLMARRNLTGLGKVITLVSFLSRELYSDLSHDLVYEASLICRPPPYISCNMTPYSLTICHSVYALCSLLYAFLINFSLSACQSTGLLKLWPGYVC
jgi:hypothetical protein